jgi:FkbH-like protein
MSVKPRNLHLISDFNAKPLAQYLAALSEPGSFEIDVAPFGQVYQSLSTSSDESGGIDVVWTLPERVIPSFAQAINLEEVDHEACIQETREFANAVQKFAERRQHVFIASWALAPGFRGYGVLNWAPGIGLSNLMARMNICLAETLSKSRNVYLLDVTRWFDGVQRALMPKMWYAAKVPFANAVFERAARDCIAAIRAVTGQSRKLIVVDLDNTLWGGVIGETGWQGIRVGGHDHVGEAFKDFQASLLALANRGVQLAVVSKNDEAVALEAFDHHSEMLVKRRHLAGWRINWNDKAANIVALAKELNLGLSAVVFIDDNPVERDRVKAALPEVLVPDWPDDPTAYVSAIRSLDCFDAAAVTSEDRNRTSMYMAERERRQVRLGVGSVDAWLSQLGTRLRVAPVDASNIARITQLFNKTNQLNLSTRRMSEQEIQRWASLPNHSMLAVSASDKFGDMGLVGVVSVDVQNKRGVLVDFILSCRVMGRKVEDAMFHVAAEKVAELGGNALEARYLPTQRNRPTLDVFRASSLTEQGDGVFIAQSLVQLAKPEQVVIEYEIHHVGK